MNKCRWRLSLIIVLLSITVISCSSPSVSSSSGIDTSNETSAAQKVLPSVVRITTGTGMGSGVVIGDGLIITNRHVVEDATVADIQTNKGDQYRAKVTAKTIALIWHCCNSQGLIHQKQSWLN